MKLTCKKCGEEFDTEQNALLHSNKTGHEEFKFKTIGVIKEIIEG